MRRILCLGSIFLMGFGCAITNYHTITDNDQVDNGNCNAGQSPCIVNTNGKAHIIETQRWGFGFGNGEVEEWINFVDQKANGDRTLTAYGNSTTLFPGISKPQSTFHDDQYCNPDWNGCSAWTADDPSVGDTSRFDGRGNESCVLSPLLKFLAAPDRLSECGRSGYTRMDIPSEIEFLRLGRYGEFAGEKGLFYDFNQSNLTMILNGDLVKIYPGSVFYSPRTGITFADLSNPLIAHTFNDMGRFLDKGTIIEDVTVVYNGITLFTGQGGVAKVIAHPSRMAMTRY